MPVAERRLAVLGSPIAHSKSPALHAAAYRVLGLPWRYDAIEVRDGELRSFLETVDGHADGDIDGREPLWRGLSLTMPLKREVLPLLIERTPLVDLVGAANTVTLRQGRWQGYNTDVAGIVAAFADAGVTRLRSVQILGAGATAASVLAAVAEMGASRVQVFAREPERAVPLERVAARLGVELDVRRLGVSDRSMIVPDAIVSTLPGGAADELPVYAGPIREGAVLLDVAYDPWPSALARNWDEVGGTVVSGLSMLMHQAVAQVRIFVTGEEAGLLDREVEVIAAMRSSVGLRG